MKFGSLSGKQQINEYYRTQRSGVPCGVSPLTFFSEDKNKEIFGQTETVYQNSK